ncbi:hypothetical protein BOW53_07130 [Solemya pervernicosa gill symbiont]|uniref:Uncharacterized protein n=2 Tax=Gammaproteobacteria incertae sedis TaxID=118884 RepID=A0A1T2L683_9GAMM|nr:hypothetical protein [Solemya pervernicosa gill symbiont]OOZ40618.1 hypothetical protein BOW53_07130 [Solemya pervernicosa gill symbiont]
MERILELTIANRETLTQSGNLTQDQLNRTVLAWQTAKVLRSISKGAWEAAKFLSGDLSSPTRVLKEMVDTMVGSDETASGSVRMGGMAALDPNSFKEEAIAQAKSGIKQMLQDEGFPPSVSQGVADGVVTNVVNSIEAGNKGGFNKMLVADIAAQAINGYVKRTQAVDRYGHRDYTGAE